MKKFVKPLLVALIFGATTAAIAQQAPKPEQIIKWRQSVYQVLAWNNGRIKASLDGTYNKDEVIRSANAIAALANAGLGALYPAGTETGKGWHDTTVKPELFTDGAKAGEAAKKFITEANELAKVANTGDAAAVKVQFGKLGQT
ncbi:cytochrome c [Zoogloea sp.]|uniref:cytochrome c n=1 Tax=Zoogloea sp. TaxID=49181 RepID=UPI0035B4F531